MTVGSEARAVWAQEAKRAQEGFTAEVSGGWAGRTRSLLARQAGQGWLQMAAKGRGPASGVKNKECWRPGWKARQTQAQRANEGVLSFWDPGTQYRVVARVRTGQPF